MCAGGLEGGTQPLPVAILCGFAGCSVHSLSVQQRTNMLAGCQALGRTTLHKLISLLCLRSPHTAQGFQQPPSSPVVPLGPNKACRVPSTYVGLSAICCQFPHYVGTGIAHCYLDATSEAIEGV